MPSGKRSGSRRPLLPVSQFKANSVLQRAELMMQGGEADEAIQLLEVHLQQHPKDAPALEMLTEIYHFVGQPKALWWALDRLMQLRPGDAIDYYNMIVLAMQQERLFTTQHYVQEYIAKFPKGEHRRDVEKILVVINKACDDARTTDEVTAHASADHLILFERARILVESGQYELGRRTAEEAGRYLSDFPPVQNIIALAYVIEGKFDTVAERCQAILARYPDNIHARSNLVQALVRLGKTDDARQEAAAMRTLIPTQDMHWIKQLEALTYLGDDAAVQAIYNKYQRQFGKSPVAMAHHLAAVASARLGDEKQAKTLWRKAVQQQPDFMPAAENLEDLKMPPGSRNGAWAFSVNEWLPPGWFRHLKHISRNARTAEREFKRFVDATPALPIALAALLERGDPRGREIALQFAIQLELPILKDFAMSANGTDQQRVQALSAAREIGLIPVDTAVTAFMQGKQTEVIPMGFEIYTESDSPSYPEAVQDRIEKIHTMLQKQQYEKALTALEEALQASPDVPQFLNYKAVALGALKRIAEADAVIRATVENHPDYAFGRCAMADLCTREKKFDEAREWLKPFQLSKRMHISEFAVFCKASFELALAEGQIEGAENWIEMMEGVDPEHPLLDYMQSKLMPALLLKRFSMMGKGRGKKKK